MEGKLVTIYATNSNKNILNASQGDKSAAVNQKQNLILV
jgi:hypothetical protein